MRSSENLAVLGNGIDFFRSTDDALASVSEQAGNALAYALSLCTTYALHSRIEFYEPTFFDIGLPHRKGFIHTF